MPAVPQRAACLARIACVGLALASAAAHADGYPEGPVTIVFPYTAGARPTRWRDSSHRRCKGTARPAVPGEGSGDYAAYVKAEVVIWTALAREANIQPE
jgi:hypothetical protein